MDADEECPQCGRLERNEEAGTIFCARCGYALEWAASAAATGAADGEDEEGREYGQTGTVVRKKKKNDNDATGTKQKSRSSAKIYRGSKGYRLFLQAWQHFLYRQCHAGIHAAGLPPEVWNVVRDLWTLRLEKLRYRFDDRGVPTQDGQKIHHDQSSGAESRIETASTTSATSEAAAAAAERKMDPTSTAHISSPRSIDSIALLYLGTLLIRYPLPIHTLHDWIMTDIVPFIRPIRYIPSEMSRHLASEYVAALETYNALPTADQLQSAIFQNATMYIQVFGMAIPPLNVPPLLHTMVEALALPLSVYQLARQLNSIVGFTFTYPAPTSASRRLPTAYPEAQVVSLIVIATKLLFPFDANRTRRYPLSLSSPGALLLDWTKWKESKDEYDRSISKVKNDRLSSHLRTRDVDVMSGDMTDDQLDQYMDWYQDTFARVDNREDDSPLAEQLLRMFPVTDRPDSGSGGSRRRRTVNAEGGRQYQEQKLALRVQRLGSVLDNALNTQNVLSEEEEKSRQAGGGDDDGKIVLRPGTQYQSVKHVKDFMDSGGSPAEAVFYAEAAEIAALTVDQLVRAVRHTELKIERWRHEQRRREMWPDENVDVDVDVDVDVNVDVEVDVGVGLDMDGEQHYEDTQPEE